MILSKILVLIIILLLWWTKLPKIYYIDYIIYAFWYYGIESRAKVKRFTRTLIKTLLSSGYSITRNIAHERRIDKMYAMRWRPGFDGGFSMGCYVISPNLLRKPRRFQKWEINMWFLKRWTTDFFKEDLRIYVKRVIIKLFKKHWSEAFSILKILTLMI